jgi:hypothetical protein
MKKFTPLIISLRIISDSENFLGDFVHISEASLLKISLRKFSEFLRISSGPSRLRIIACLWQAECANADLN